ncbi:MAG: molybdopterin-binding protein, partial [Actinomycetota bacterium]
MRRPEGKAADTGSGSSGLGGFAAAIVTVSDSVSRGENTDESGPAAAQLISERGAELLDRTVVPDEEEAIA